MKHFFVLFATSIALLHSPFCIFADTITNITLNDQGLVDKMLINYLPGNYSLSTFGPYPGFAGSISTYSSLQPVTITGSKDGTIFTYTGFAKIVEKFHVENDLGFFDFQVQPQDDPFLSNHTYPWGDYVEYSTTHLGTDTSLPTGIGFLMNSSLPSNPPNAHSIVVYPFSPLNITTDSLLALTYASPEPNALTLSGASLLSLLVFRAWRVSFADRRRRKGDSLFLPCIVNPP